MYNLDLRRSSYQRRRKPDSQFYADSERRLEQPKPPLLGLKMFPWMRHGFGFIQYDKDTDSHGIQNSTPSV